MESNEDATGGDFMTLRLVVGARQNVEISPRDVFVLVFFYEMVDGQYIVQTNADVPYHWIDLPANWQGPRREETLEVDYYLPGGESVVENAPLGEDLGGSRDYYGYIARIYYKSELQDAVAEPISLLNQFPPQTTLPLE
jgi:hypothetical protein